LFRNENHSGNQSFELSLITGSTVFSGAQLTIYTIGAPSATNSPSVANSPSGPNWTLIEIVGGSAGGGFLVLVGIIILIVCLVVRRRNRRQRPRQPNANEQNKADISLHSESTTPRLSHDAVQSASVDTSIQPFPLKTLENAKSRVEYGKTTTTNENTSVVQNTNAEHQYESVSKVVQQDTNPYDNLPKQNGANPYDNLPMENNMMIPIQSKWR